MTLEDDAGGETTEIDETWALSFLLKQLSIALELGNRAEETDAYINLGNYYEGQLIIIPSTTPLPSNYLIELGCA